MRFVPKRTKIPARFVLFLLALGAAAARLGAMFGLGAIAPRSRMADGYGVQGMRELWPDTVLGDRGTLRQETRDHVWGTPPLPPVLRDEHQLVSRYFGVKRTCDTIV